MPPSPNAVLHALATGGTIPISALFMAGVFPGPLLGFSLILLCIVIAYREGHPHGQRVPAKDSVLPPPPEIQLAAGGIRSSSAR
ncbi:MULTISPECIES: TRAP transporter large permease subunit [unclassified Bradyrhizobium]|uniref:TRAP transporter large permease subunit n=1 Tax=unclassified Bradyrhizobium TaxID=2631580 RepID=UPI002915EE95|nr:MULTISPECIES: TRAP transporter large permease subunit [unclassified Bradyrhizobium]